VDAAAEAGEAGWPSPTCIPSVHVYAVNARVYPQRRYDLTFYAESGSRVVVDLSIRDEPLPRNNDVRVVLCSPSGNVIADVVARGPTSMSLMHTRVGRTTYA